jgi:hypothetical protein
MKLETSGVVEASRRFVAGFACLRFGGGVRSWHSGEVARRSTEAPHHLGRIPSAKTGASSVGARPPQGPQGPDALSLATAGDVTGAAGTRDIGALNATARYNKAVDTDAQGRPLSRFAPCAPDLGRRSLLRWTASKCVAALMLLLLTLPAAADSFYTLVGYQCDRRADTLTITYDGAYNEAGKMMLDSKLATQWDPWRLVSMRDDNHIGKVKTIRRTCRLSDGVYKISLWAVPGNSNIQGRCGAHMSAGAEVTRAKRVLTRVPSFESDCHDLESPVITRINIRARAQKGIEASVPYKEFYK